MNCHEFNIGTEEALKEEYRNKNLLNDWWTYLLKQNVITLGFDSEIGDRGTYLLGTKVGEGDWVFAYANGHGFVGVGLVNGSYEFQGELPPDYLSTHHHHRSVRWLYYVESLNDAIPASEIGNFYLAAATVPISDDSAKNILKAFWQNTKTVIRL